MQRRGVIGMILGGMAAAPAAIKSVAAEIAGTAGMGSPLPNMISRGIASSGEDSIEAMDEGPSNDGPYLHARSQRSKDYLTTNMLDTFYRHPKALEYDRLVHDITSLSPHIAGMRSISMVNKIRLSRIDQHDHWRYLHMKRQRMELEGIFDDESDKLRDKVTLGQLTDLPGAMGRQLLKVFARITL